MNTADRFSELKRIAKEDSKIIGFFLSGSRGKGLQTRFSDYDIYFIVKDKHVQDYKKRYPQKKYENMDLVVLSLSEFRELGNWTDGSWFYRYAFAHVKTIIDKNGEIQKIIDLKARIPEDYYEKFLEKSLDGYINYFYRSIKCLRDGNLLAARLEASYSIPLFFDVIFGIHERRIRPYYKYLKWEMENFPLKKIPISTEELLNKISKILDDADLIIQQELFKLTEKLLINEGYEHVFRSWGGDISWMKSFKNK